MRNDQRLQQFSRDLALTISREFRDEDGEVMPSATPQYVRGIAGILRATADHIEHTFIADACYRSEPKEAPNETP